MTVSPFASQVKIDAALTALGADLIGQTEQQLLQQLVVAAATASGGGGGGGGAVTSVNGQTGVVVLDPEDIGLTLPISISNGGTGSTTPQAARVALGVSEIIAAVAQVVVVTVQNSATAGWAGEYVDIDDGTEVCRFWFTVDGSGTAPSAPSPGRLQVVALGDGFGGGFSPADVETAFVAAFSSQSSAFSVASSAFGYFTVTNLTAGAAPGNGTSLPTDFSFSTSTAGADAISRLAEADGSQLTNINATFIPSPGPTTRGGVYASNSFTGQYVKGLSTNGDLIYSTGAMPIANGGTGQTTAVAAFDALAPTTTKGDLIVHNGTDNVRLAVGPTNGHVLTVDSAEASGVKWAASGGGKVAQVVVAKTSTPVSTTSQIPTDNTIPQQTEGAEFLTATITPTNASSTLIIEFRSWGTNNTNCNLSVALFRDSTANAIQVTTVTNSVSNHNVPTILLATVSAGSTATTTFKIRFGPNVATTSFMLRSNSVASFFGGSDSAILTITEILP
jgi:hypothetical protein